MNATTGAMGWGHGLMKSIPGAWVVALALWGLAVNVSLAQTAVAPAAGDGLTTDTAYQLTELGNLVWLQEQTLADAATTATVGVYYKLMNDIDASVTATWNDAGTTTETLEGFEPIGAIHSFAGVFLGQGHAITGLSINRPLKNVGLFASLRPGARVQDLRLVGGSIHGASEVGALAGHCQNTMVINCQASAEVFGSEGVGGLIGMVDYIDEPEDLVPIPHSIVTHCSASGSVRGILYVGGLIGWGLVEMNDCHATGTVQGSERVGGLIGQLEHYSATHCSATGTVVGSMYEVGGLIGLCMGSAIYDCQATGPVTGIGWVGGLIGQQMGSSSISVWENLDTGSLTACITSGPVKGIFYVGGMLGYGGAIPMSLCYATGDVSGHSEVGGFVGDDVFGIISQCYATGVVSGVKNVGGFVGRGNQTYLTDCYATGAVNGTIADGLGDGIITRCYFLGAVNGLSQMGGSFFVDGSSAPTSFTLTGPHPWDYGTTWTSQGAYPYLVELPTCTLRYAAGVHGAVTDGTTTTTAGQDPLLQVVNLGAVGLTVTAVPDAGYRLAWWSDGVTDNPRTDTRATTRSATALFLVPLSVTVEASPTSHTTPTWSWHSGGGSGTYRYQLDALAEDGWVTGPQTAFTPAAALGDGVHTLYVEELDAEGRWTLGGSAAVTVDATAPGAPLVRAYESPTAYPNWEWAGGGGGNGTFSYRLSPSEPWVTTTDFSFVTPGAQPNGTYTLYLRESDALGHWSPVSECSIVIKNNAAQEWQDYQ